MDIPQGGAAIQFFKKKKQGTSNSQDKLVKIASAVENLAAAHQRVVPSLHSHGV